MLSGTIDGTMIYEKAMFSCGGTTINTFAMTYPVAERGFYDRIVEGIEHTFRPALQECPQNASFLTGAALGDASLPPLS